MNKNQEALNRVNKAITIALACQGIDLKEDNETVLALKTLQELVDEHKKLKDKATPKKLKPFQNSFYIKICPNCSSTLETKRNYCDNCGQKLDWSKKDE